MKSQTNTNKVGSVREVSNDSSRMFGALLSSLENLPALQVDEVHVWRVSLNVSSFQLNKLRELLASNELARADRFLREVDSDRFITARACLRLLLASYLLIEPNETKHLLESHRPQSVDPSYPTYC